MKQEEDLRSEVTKWLADPHDTDLLRLSHKYCIEAMSRLIRISPRVALNVILSLGTYQPGRELLFSISLPVLNALENEPSRTKRRITWWHLRPVGNYKILKVSYLAFLEIPFAEKIPELLKVSGRASSNLLTTFLFGSVVFAFANLLFDVFCPNLVKRFESANDLYEKNLNLKIKQIKSYPNDDWIGDLTHSKNAYENQNRARRAVCVLTFWGYVISSVSLVVVALGGLYYLVRHAG